MVYRLTDYDTYFHSDRALWHVHTSRTDGEFTVEEVLDRAAARGVEFVCFIEHIRSEPTYSPEALREEVARCSRERGVRAMVGFEAKLLPDGTVDIPRDGLEGFVFLAEHGGLVERQEEYVGALTEGLSNPVVSGWVHPGLHASRMRWTFGPHDVDRIVEMMTQNHVVYEVSKKYHLPVPPLADALVAAGLPCFTGVDLHHEADWQWLGTGRT